MTRPRLTRVVDHFFAFRRLPPGVAGFYLRAVAVALFRRDRAALRDVTRPLELQLLLERSMGCREVVELGTGPAWTAVAFALADPVRHVVTFDPKTYEHRSRYVQLVPTEVRNRIEFRSGRGEETPSPTDSPDFVFIDSRHEREPTVQTFRSWQAVLQPGGLVVFHDFGNPHWPGVLEAVPALGLEGERLPYLFVWRKPIEEADFAAAD
jgi:SAM-dependent methyltransferase